MRRTLLIFILSLAFSQAWAQMHPERRFVRQGNKAYAGGDYAGAEVGYLRAMAKDSNSYEANFNLSSSYYKQQRFEEAEKKFKALSEKESAPPVRSQAYYDLGNSLFKQRKLEEALEAYKNALRQNPSDQEAKFNLAYTKKLLEKNKDNQENQDNKDNKEDQNNQDNKDNKGNGDNKEKPDNKDGHSPPQEQPQGGMNRKEAERMLDAIQNSEDNTRKKVDSQEVQAVGRSNKNW